jgi:hypothetical protein
MPHFPVNCMVRGALTALLLSGLTATAAPPKHRFELYIPAAESSGAMVTGAALDALLAKATLVIPYGR